MTDAQPTPAEEEQPYFPVSRQKLIVMSVTTLSMYQIYWFYKNYERVNARMGGGGSPFWRAIAAPITAHGLFARVRTDAQSRFIPVSWSSAGLAAIYFGSTLLCFFDYPWWTLALGSVFALLPVHATMDAVNGRSRPTARAMTASRLQNAVWIVVGTRAHDSRARTSRDSRSCSSSSSWTSCDPSRACVWPSRSHRWRSSCTRAPRTARRHRLSRRPGLHRGLHAAARDRGRRDGHAHRVRGRRCRRRHAHRARDARDRVEGTDAAAGLSRFARASRDRGPSSRRVRAR